MEQSPIWSPQQAELTLRQAREDLAKSWLADSRATLWHLSGGLLRPGGEARQVGDRLLDQLERYFAALCEWQDTPLRPAELSEEDEAVARSLTTLPIAWQDVVSLVSLLISRTRQVLSSLGADTTILELSRGFLNAVLVFAASRRIADLEAAAAAHREEAAVTQHLAGRFLANASHELRTPLTAVLGFAELLQDESYGALTPEQAGAVSNIHNSAQNLIEIVNNLLDLLQIRSGKLTLQYRPVEVKQVLENIFAILTPLSQRKRVEFRLELAPDLGVIEGDENIVRHIVYYLVSSSLRATPAAGEVKLRAWRDGSTFTIETTDNAFHLPPEAIQNMLEPFPRIENSPARGYEGWEVGLPLVRRYVELHRGSLKLHSRPDAGTVFQVVLPAKQG